MLDLSLFRYPRFVSVQLLAAAPAYGFVVLLILLPVRFIGIEGMSAVAAGTQMIALSAPLLVVPVVAGLLTRWLRPALLCGGGLVVSAAGLFWLGLTPVGAPAMATGGGASGGKSGTGGGGATSGGAWGRSTAASVAWRRPGPPRSGSPPPGCSPRR